MPKHRDASTPQSCLATCPIASPAASPAAEPLPGAQCPHLRLRWLEKLPDAQQVWQVAFVSAVHPAPADGAYCFTGVYI